MTKENSVLMRQVNALEAIIVEGQTNPCDVTVLPFVELSIQNPPINIEALNKAVLISVKANPSLRSFFEETPETQTKVGRFQMHCFSSEYADNNFSWFTHLDGVGFKDMHGKLEELSSRIPGIGQKPQFHVYLLTTSTEARKACLALFYNHAISDGQSGQVLINQILQTYTQISTPSLEEPSKLQEVSPEDIAQILDVIDDLPRESYQNLVETINQQNEGYEPAIPVETVGTGLNGFVTDKSKVSDLKNKVKLEKTTVGMALLAAVYLAISDSKTPLINIDVDLRTRLEPDKQKLKYDEMVGLCIGMSNVYKAAKVKPKNKDGKLDFWTYVRSLQAALLQGFEENHHFGFIKAVEQRYEENLPDNKDLNFSNMGLYKYPRHFPNFDIEAYYTPGNAWCPLMFGNMVFLANTVGDEICYTMVFEKSKKNRELGKKMLNDIKGILEENEK